MPNVAEHVAGGHDPRESGQLHQLLQLHTPLLLVGEVHVGAELDRLELLRVSASAGLTVLRGGGSGGGGSRQLFGSQLLAEHAGGVRV